MSAYRIEHGEREDFPTLTLHSPDDLSLTYAPSAGMVGCSLRHRGQELLGQCQGLRAYAEAGVVMGIPFLHPWANRLAREGFAVDGVEIPVPNTSPRVHPDPNGLPIHGLVAGWSNWEVQTAADANGARLVARLDWGHHPDLLALFPFRHEIRMEVELCGTTLSIGTRVRASGDLAVPVAWGYHPYFRLPDVPRREWEVTLPVRRRAVLDERCLPTGEEEPVRIEPGPLGERVLDDLFTELEPDPVFVLAGAGRRIAVSYGAAYPVAVVYAPADDDVVCFEPMTAPTNPFDGPRRLLRIRPGEEHAATFRIAVT